MGKMALKEIKIELPGDLGDIASSKEIITMLLDKALSKAEYFGSRCRAFEEKYGMDVVFFKKRVEGSKDEIFTEWDDLVVWEGYELCYEEWKRKYEELKRWIE